MMASLSLYELFTEYQIMDPLAHPPGAAVAPGAGGMLRSAPANPQAATMTDAAAVGQAVGD